MRISYRTVVVASFVVLLASTATSSGLTEANHMTYLEREDVTGTPIEYSATGDGATIIRVTVQFENPHPRPIVVEAPKTFEAFLAGQRIAALSIQNTSPTRVPAFGTATRTVTLEATPQGAARWKSIRRAVDEQTLVVSGVFRARISEKRFSLSVPEGTPDDA